MSLVDYASSSDDEELPQPQPSTSHPSTLHSSVSNELSSDKTSQEVAPSLPAPFQRLPDASALLSSPISSLPTGSDHSSRVAAAMAENASRKREANGSGSSSVRGKIPRGNLPHSKNIPDTSSGLLMPPQLRGRSNIVTEDISKLFVQRKSQEKS